MPAGEDRYGSNCNIAGCLPHGSFTPESGNSLALQYLEHWANSCRRPE
jgi:hypothetical protein